MIKPFITVSTGTAFIDSIAEGSTCLSGEWTTFTIAVKIPPSDHFCRRPDIVGQGSVFNASVPVRLHLATKAKELCLLIGRPETDKGRQESVCELG